jgi:hypothetical protein
MVQVGCTEGDARFEEEILEKKMGADVRYGPTSIIHMGSLGHS